MDFLLDGILSLATAEGFKMIIMWAVGGLLIYLAIGKGFEPALLLPMGFGAILVNIPLSGALTQDMLNMAGEKIGESHGIIEWLYTTTIAASEALPLLLFIGIGAMIDFGPLLSNPKMMLFGAAAQFGIFFAISAAVLTAPIFGISLTIQDAAAIGIIGAADGPTSILVANIFQTPYVGAIAVAAYSYMALVPIVQPFAIKLVTTKKERMIRMPYNPKSVSRVTRLLFPVFVTIIAGLVAPASVALVGFLMFGNLIRECGVLDSLSQTAQKEFANIITLLLGITISFSMRAEDFVRKETVFIMVIGLIAFVFDSIGGVLFAKLLNLIPGGQKINPMVGAAGISAFPMSARVIQKMALKEDNQNHLLMHAVGANVSGQIASVIAGGIILGLVPQLIK